MTRAKTWALVTNGVAAKIVRGLRKQDDLEPIEMATGAVSTHLRDIMADKSGRSFSSGSPGARSAMEPGADPVKRDMQDFARETLSFLDEEHRKGEFEQLAIIAAPRMLGILRQEMPSTLADAVMFEHAGNYLHVTDHELKGTVSALIEKEARA